MDFETIYMLGMMILFFFTLNRELGAGLTSPLLGMMIFKTFKIGYI